MLLHNEVNSRVFLCSEKLKQIDEIRSLLTLLSTQPPTPILQWRCQLELRKLSCIAYCIDFILS